MNALAQPLKNYRAQSNRFKTLEYERNLSAQLVDLTAAAEVEGRSRMSAYMQSILLDAEGCDHE